MLIAKGFHCRFLLEDGSARRGAVLLHDESGDSWPATSGLIVPSFIRSGKPCDDGDAQRYYGDDYPLRCGRVVLPPRDLTRWRKLGPVTDVEYTRRGMIDEDGEQRDFIDKDDYEHAFKRSFFQRLRGWKTLPLLYRLGPAMRLELGPGAEWNWRGIVSP